MLPGFAYARPTTLADAVKALADGQGRVHAGGTDLLGCLRDGVFTAPTVVSLSGVPSLRGIDSTPDGGLRIGALTTLTEVAESETVRTRYRALAEASASVGSPQLRNQGTLGGNLCQKPRCWYYRGDFHCLRKGGESCFAVAGENDYHCLFGGEGCFIVHPSDVAPALVALGAALRIVGPGGARTVPVEAFHVPPKVDPHRETVLEPGEIVAEAILPPAIPGLRSTYRKVRARASWDFALVGAAFALRLAGDVVREARVAFAGVAPVPWRAKAVEAALTGHRLDAATIVRAAAAAVKGAEPLARNGYKVPLLRGLVEERLAAIARG
ncbi:MAG TPA: xanthine dehydrogenase family protein subunit M [Vicinamibacteria bacterium]|nr:xanthine dehydrogenase family protein subunit M [Vicinamibacteria bacterium]